MPYNYHDPKTVTSPREFIETPINVIYDGGINSYSIAKFKWEGSECYGIRWNIARREYDDPEKASGRVKCVGMPSSHGLPVWFILPSDLIDKNCNGFKELEKLLF